MKSVFRSLNQLYYLIYTLIILMAISGYLLNLNGFLSVTFSETTELIFLAIQSSFTLSAIIIFAYFVTQGAKFAAIIDLKMRASYYLKLAKLRLLLIGASLFTGVFCLYIVRSEIVLYQIAICAVLLLVSKPIEARMENRLS